MKLQRLRDHFLRYWRPIVTYGALAALLVVALTWRLHTLPSGYSGNEASAYNASLNFERIFENPINAPFLLLVRLVQLVHPDSYLATRIVAVMLGIAVLAVFAIVLHSWHGMRTAVVGTLLFGLSAWFLHTARLGTPEVLYFGVFALAVTGYWAKTSGGKIALLLCFLLMSALLYVPGMAWFILLGILWQWRAIDRIFKRHLVIVTLGTLLSLVLLVPLAWAIYRHPSIITAFLALPSSWPAPAQIIANLTEIPYQLLLHNQPDPERWLGNVPILDAFSAAMLFLGGYQYLRHIRIARSPILISILALALILHAVGSPLTFSIVMPLIYMIIAAGVAYLFDSWFTVFPRNPIARSLGWGFMVLVLFIVTTYHVSHYFVAWPQARLTHQVYTESRPQTN